VQTTILVHAIPVFPSKLPTAEVLPHVTFAHTTVGSTSPPSPASPLHGGLLPQSLHSTMSRRQPPRQNSPNRAYSSHTRNRSPVALLPLNLHIVFNIPYIRNFPRSVKSRAAVEAVLLLGAVGVAIIRLQEMKESRIAFGVSSPISPRTWTLNYFLNKNSPPYYSCQYLHYFFPSAIISITNQLDILIPTEGPLRIHIHIVAHHHPRLPSKHLALPHQNGNQVHLLKI
jgi:hypothetical protein